MPHKEKNNKQKKIILIISAVVIFLLAAAGGYFYFAIFREDSSNSSITAIEGDDSEAGSVDASLTYSGYATLISEDDLITLNFANPKKSRKTLSLDIVANIDGEDIVLARTAKVHPGYKIDGVKYELNRDLPKGTYQGRYIVHFYDDDDNEEIVNSKIEIKIYIK